MPGSSGAPSCACESRYNTRRVSKETGLRFERLVEIMDTLRGPNGCPWDKEQNADTLKPMMIEEVYEVIDAIDQRDPEGVSEELGDMLLHIVFQARLGKEAAQFDIDAVLDKICDKLVRRHPHVFGTAVAGTPDEVLRNWDAIKTQERTEAGARSDEPILARVPTKLPALHESHQISSKVAKVGFDWPDVHRVIEKVQEEIAELRQAIANQESSDRMESELGDIYFSLVNVARHLRLDSESALKRANRKFRERFGHVETELRKRGQTLDQTSLEEMESLWQQAKTLLDPDPSN